jgi:hypothetical protein
LRAPDGAPNVVIVLIDDMGFGIPSAFGGCVDMPTTDRLAKGGLRYNQMHTTALLLADPRGAAHRAQPPLGEHGCYHRIRHVVAWRHRYDPQHLRQHRPNSQAQRV